MALWRVGCYFLTVITSCAVSFSAGEEKYATDWITPPVKLNDQLTKVCAIDLELSQKDDQWIGTVTLYSGVPAYDPFGDADRKLLEATRSPIAFSRVEPEETKPQEPSRKQELELWQPIGTSALTRLRLVLSSQDPYRNRLLITNSGYPLRVLPLQSEQLKRLAVQHPLSSREQKSLWSSLFIGVKNQPNSIHLVSNAGQLSWIYDANRLNLDDYGDVAASTLLLPLRQKLTLTDLQLVDATGQDRRVFRCELNGKSKLNDSPKDDETFFFDGACLVLHPFVPGWHRLILMRQERVERIIPMHSELFRNWLITRSQVTDGAEKNVFDSLSKELPFFSDFSFEDGHVASASVTMSPDNERVLDRLPELAHLHSLGIRGNVKVGEQLEKLKQLKALHFSEGIVTQETLKHVGRIAQLRTLSFDTVHLDCRGLQYLSGLRELTRFEFRNGGEKRVEHYDEQYLDVFSGLPKLKILDLSGMPLSEAAIARLPRQNTLDRISFYYNVPAGSVLKFAKLNPSSKIEVQAGEWSLGSGLVQVPGSAKDDDLQELQGMQELQKLGVDQAEFVTDKGLAYLATLKLKQLSLSHNRNITDAGVSEIAKIQTLEELNFWYCEKLTDASIPALKRLPSLKKITVFGTKIDPQLLKQQLPNCEIER